MCRLQQIDELLLPDHWWLGPDDDCYFLHEYTPRQGFAYSPGNSRILNLKKSVTRRGRPEYYYKDQAIEQCATEFVAVLPADWLAAVTLVPVPPSFAMDHAEYDDRLRQVLGRMARKAGHALDVRELVRQVGSFDPVHHCDVRPSPEDLAKRYVIDESLTDPPPRIVAIVDDVLTTGCHFKAMESVIKVRFPGTPCVGLFVARRVPGPEPA